MIDKAILAKIKKCLALAASANEHEAAAALEKARAMMAEHGIDESAVDLADIEEFAARGSRTQRSPLWEGLLCATVRRAIGVDVVIDYNLDRLYVGRGARPEIAGYAFLVLHRQLKRARADYIAKQLRRCKPARKRQRADIFCQGWATAVFRKIATLVPDREDDPLIGQYLATRFEGLGEAKSRAASLTGKAANDDWWRGNAKGRDVDLNQGVGGGAEQQALLA